MYERPNKKVLEFVRTFFVPRYEETEISQKYCEIIAMKENHFGMNSIDNWEMADRFQRIVVHLE